MDKPTVFRNTLLASLLFAAWISPASAYQNYSTDGTDNCAACHGDFNVVGTYISLADGASWGDNLHNVHQTMVSNDCATCHTAPSRSPVILASSDGGTGLDPISCLGCHGRVEGTTVTGAGLRQHHFTSGETICFGCHSDDTDPAVFTPVGEDVLPPYYAITPDAAHPDKPTDPCNPNGEEDFAGTTIGLDNDGDGLYDQADPDCQPDINLSPAGLDFGAVPAGTSVVLNAGIQNLGTADLNVSLISLCAGTSTEFSWLPDAPITVAPGASQTLEVTYAPVDDGIDTGCLAISSNDPDEAVKQLGLNLSRSSILRFLSAFIHPDQTGAQ